MEQIKAEIEILKREIIDTSAEEIVIISGIIGSVQNGTATPETITTDLKRVAFLIMNVESGMRSWRHPSGIVPMVPPVSKLAEGIHPLATFELSTTLPIAQEELLRDTTRDDSNVDQGGEPYAGSEETSTPADLSTVEASDNALGSPAPDITVQSAKASSAGRTRRA